MTASSPSLVLSAGRHVVFPFVVAGRDRRYTVHVPQAYDGSSALPVVLLLHGAGGSGSLYLDKNGWAEKAEKEHFIVVAPDGLPAAPDMPMNFAKNPRVWNTGQLPADNPRTRIDDVAFFRLMLTQLEKQLRIDSQRIYLAGHSNGGGMAFRTAAEASEHFAALAVLAGHCWFDAPRPVQPMPTLFMIGTQDPLVPLKGGKVKMPWGNTQNRPPIDDTLRRWAGLLGCPPEAHVLSDKKDAQITHYGPGRNGSALTVYFIHKHGHGWPGGLDVGLPERFLGPHAKTVNATDVLWGFFKQHRLS